MTLHPLLTFAVCPLLCLAAGGDCGKGLDAPLPAGQRVSMDIRSGDIEIVGTAGAGLRVTCRVDDGAHSEPAVRFAANHLRIDDGPTGFRQTASVHFRIEVPAVTNLQVRVTAGNLSVKGVTGDKDVELKAGNLTIDVGRPELYRVVDGSVLAGDLRAEPFAVNKSGLLRSFHRSNETGRYRLRAELLGGNLTLQ